MIYTSLLDLSPTFWMKPPRLLWHSVIQSIIKPIAFPMSFMRSTYSSCTDRLKLLPSFMRGFFNEIHRVIEDNNSLTTPASSIR